VISWSQLCEQPAPFDLSITGTWPKADRFRNFTELAFFKYRVHRQQAGSPQLDTDKPIVDMQASITVVIFYWHICLISESMGHHDSEIMDDGSID
jgi:hypothetical protein